MEAPSPEGSLPQVLQGLAQNQQQVPPALCLALVKGCACLPQGRICSFSPFSHCLCGTETCFSPWIILEG